MLNAPLTTEILDRFEMAIVDAVPRLAEFIRPGLSGEEVLELTRELPGSLSREAILYWGWQNGVDDIGGISKYGRFPMTFGGAEFRLSSLRECLDLYNEKREFALSLEAIDPETVAPERWFPIDGSLSIDLTHGETEVSPVIATDGYVPDQLGQTVTGSIGELILCWIESLENGSLRWDEESVEGWVTDHDRVNPTLRKFGLV